MNHTALSPLNPFQQNTLVHPYINWPMASKKINTNAIETPPNLVYPRIDLDVTKLNLTLSDVYAPC